MQEIELRKLFDFDEKDLVANRRGQVTERQAKILKQAASIGRGIMIAIAVPILIWGVFFPVKSIVNDINRFGFNAGLLGAAVFALIMAVIAFSILRNIFKKDVVAVRSVEGQVNFVKVEKRVTSKGNNGLTNSRVVHEYELRVGSEKFEDVSENLLNIIQEGDTYTFYFTGDTHHILSCEFISKGK